jgi:hypothetical protein
MVSLLKVPAKILYAFPIPPMHAMCPANLILLDLITLTVFGNKE